MNNLEINLSKLEEIFQYLFVSYLSLTIFANIGEVYSLLNNTIVSQSVIATPLIIKIIREILFILLFSVGLAFVLYTKKIPSLIIYVLILLYLLIISILLSITTNTNTLVILSGLRWSLPLFIPIFFYRLVSYNTIQLISRILLVILFMHVIFQLLQFFVGLQWYQINKLGFSKRSPGIFLIPNTAGFFSIISLYYFEHFLFIENNTKIILKLLISVSIFLTASGTAIVTLILYFIIGAIPRKYHRLSVVLMPVIIPLLGIISLLLLQIIRGANYIAISGGTRISILMKVLEESNLFSHNFGGGTYTALLFNEGSGISTDSFLAAVVVNFGLVGFIFLIILYLWAVWCLWRRNNKEVTQIILILVLFSLTTIITEVRPAGILTIVAFVFVIKNKNTNVVKVWKKTKTYN